MIRLIACEVMKEELLALRRNPLVEVEFTAMGLHVSPEKLRAELQTRLAEPRGAERIVLGFGLCGGALAGLKSPGVPLLVPRTHDCIPIFLGSSALFDAVRAEETGTLFLTGGWMEGERTYLAEYRRVIEKYGAVRGGGLMKTLFASYRRVLLIRTGHPKEEARRKEAQELAEVLGLEFQEREGRDAWLDAVINGPWDSERFLEIPPCGEIQQDHFLGLAA